MSSFAGRGKKKAFEMVRDNQVIRDSVGVLGEPSPERAQHNQVRRGGLQVIQ